ncbi:hypothetical protein B296_00002655 [Ensete ventricosum]|uniref:Uncharacterized protein n=1 Tax=Ensete ventricosum TaxID=4639 RepID=A0A426ZJ94_ENSVE|nr:hypothetical protein B296_00002655 [Ensete ventricosum]
MQQRRAHARVTAAGMRTEDRFGCAGHGPPPRGESEGKLAHRIIGAVGVGVEKDEVRGNADKDTQEEEDGARDYCVLSVDLVGTHPLET